MFARPWRSRSSARRSRSSRQMRWQVAVSHDSAGTHVTDDVDMTEVFDAHTTTLRVTELPAAKCPEGSVATGVAMLTATEALEVGVWEHPVGVSTDIETDEVFVVVSGRGRVILSDGQVLELSPGVVGVLEAGTATTWIVDETLRKVWVTER